MIKKKVKISTPNVQAKFYSWFIEKSLLYGDAFEKWWKEEGLDLFFVWAKKHNLEFMDLERKH